MEFTTSQTTFLILYCTVILKVTVVYGKTNNDEYAKEAKCSCENEIPGLPTYTAKQIEEHYSKERGGIWASYQSGVYNLTDFIDKHPGGPRILSAAGGHLEPYWNFLPVHKHEHVYKFLEFYRIGNLDVHERKEAQSYTRFDPFAEEQQNRKYKMEAITDKPYNANPYPEDLDKSFITPNDLHYIRLHLPIPSIMLKYYSVTVAGFGVQKSVSLTLEDIQNKFVKQILNVTLQCSGNRRSEMNKIKRTHGVAYKHTAISTATWGGVWLMDVLKHWNVNTSHPQIKYINFEGLDQDPSGQQFGASVPAEIALDPNSDLLIAYEMNGKALPPDHGYPVRMIIPGMAGFKSVKFLAKITLTNKEVNNVWEQRMYRFYRPNFNWDNIDYGSSPSLLYTNVQSSILVPSNNNVLGIGDNNTTVSVRGYAFSGGGNKIRRVDVTTDGGDSWVNAQILDGNDASHRRNWVWSFWEAKINTSGLRERNRNGTKISIACRAFDSQYNSQPKDVETIWNMMGVLVNHWHTVSVTINHTRI